MTERATNDDHASPLRDDQVPVDKNGSIPQVSESSQTAQEFIASQLQLEADAREALPYQFDTCTKALGPLRQNVYSCLTCNPPPTDPDAPYAPGGVCYSCSISCHGEHELVELFSKRYFVCDCGTTRLPKDSVCTLRPNSETGRKGDVHSETPAATNHYNHNFRSRFCGCGGLYDPHQEKGTMFQCLGLDGGCGEDWWHPECIVGLSRDWNQKKNTQKTDAAIERAAQTTETTGIEPVLVEETSHVTTGDGEVVEEAEAEFPPGFPSEDDFDHLICYKCIDAFPWMKRYANMSGFTFVSHSKHSKLDIDESKKTDDAAASAPTTIISQTISEDGDSKKRKASEHQEDKSDDQSVKRSKLEDTIATPAVATCKHASLPPPPSRSVSLFMPSDFREDLCRCASCFPIMSTNPQLLEEEESYEPPISEPDGEDGENGSVGSRSLLDRGEAALSNMDRVRAIEGVMAYNHLKDKLTTFLRPFAENGETVSAEHINAYFAKLRGDEAAIRSAGLNAQRDGDDNGDGDNRKEQSGY